MSVECVECGSRVHGCFPCHNCGCELPPLLTGHDAEIAKLREENERFKVMYKGFENQFMSIRERDAVISDLKEECKQLRIALKQEEDHSFQVNQDLSSMREHCCQLEDINERLSREVKRLAPLIALRGEEEAHES